MMDVACRCGRKMQQADTWDGYDCPCGFTLSSAQLVLSGVNHAERCPCSACNLRRWGGSGATTPPIQEADGHFRGCPRLGKCHCPANAPRDEWRPDDAP